MVVIGGVAVAVVLLAIGIWRFRERRKRRATRKEAVAFKRTSTAAKMTEPRRCPTPRLSRKLELDAGVCAHATKDRPPSTRHSSRFEGPSRNSRWTHDETPRGTAGADASRTSGVETSLPSIVASVDLLTDRTTINLTERASGAPGGRSTERSSFDSLAGLAAAEYRMAVPPPAPRNSERAKEALVATLKMMEARNSTPPRDSTAGCAYANGHFSSRPRDSAAGCTYTDGHFSSRISQQLTSRILNRALSDRRVRRGRARTNPSLDAPGLAPTIEETCNEAATERETAEPPAARERVASCIYSDGHFSSRLSRTLASEMISRALPSPGQQRARNLEQKRLPGGRMSTRI